MANTTQILLTYSDAVTNQNKTDTTHLPIRIRRDEIGWILCQAAATFFTIISVYLTMAAIIYNFRNWKRRRLLNCNHAFSGKPLSTISGRTTILDSNTKRRPRLSTAGSTASNSMHRRISALDVLIVAAGVFVTLRIASEQQFLNFSDRSHHICDIIADVHVALYALSIAAIYIFLWLRQRILYSRPPLSLFNSRKVRTVSAIIIIVMVVGGVATALVFTLTIHYKPGAYGCEMDRRLLPDWVPWLIIIVLSSCFQILLLSLYVAPMICMRLERNSSKQDVEQGRLRRHGEDPVMRSIKRVCAITFACVLSDALAVSVTRAIHIPVVSNLVYDLNLLVNLFGITCSFSNWKERIFFVCRRRERISKSNRGERGNKRTVVSISQSVDTLATIAEYCVDGVQVHTQPISAQSA